MEKTEFSIQIDTAEEPMKQEEAVSKVHEELEKQESLIELVVKFLDALADMF